MFPKLITNLKIFFTLYLHVKFIHSPHNRWSSDGPNLMKDLLPHSSVIYSTFAEATRSVCGEGRSVFIYYLISKAHSKFLGPLHVRVWRLSPNSDSAVGNWKWKLGCTRNDLNPENSDCAVMGKNNGKCTIPGSKIEEWKEKWFGFFFRIMEK